ncbi:Spy/CpxP family protein refolding chaperone [Bradyrhizobium sp. CB82]|uniref:Spy/CpxP family protein refolding chaperone n=1 Tax=Bradyrhizobium sp. CB82 TaxID=3039159 RepID=UPI0032C20DBB
MTNRVSATLEAVKIVRPALEKFYGSLSDEQQARFNALGPNIGEPSQQQPECSARELRRSEIKPDAAADRTDRCSGKPGWQTKGSARTPGRRDQTGGSWTASYLPE